VKENGVVCHPNKIKNVAIFYLFSHNFPAKIILAEVYQTPIIAFEPEFVSESDHKTNHW